MTAIKTMAERLSRSGQGAKLEVDEFVVVMPPETACAMNAVSNYEAGDREP
jgi:hypothetical protein